MTKTPKVIVAALIVLGLLFTLRQARGAPLYCKPLEKFERSCAGVKAAAAVLGRARAEALARKCGATDDEMAQAAACFIDPRCDGGGRYDAMREAYDAHKPDPCNGAREPN